MLIDHLEDHLGEIATGWPSDCGRFQVALFEDAIDEADAYVTLGVSRHPLNGIRQEFLLLAPSSLRGRNAPGILMQAAAEALDSVQARLRGDLIQRTGSVFAGAAFSSLYVTLPVYLPESFAVAQDGAGNDIAICWLVPILPEEERIVREQGWGQFEELLEQQDPDLTDFKREGVRAQA